MNRQIETLIETAAGFVGTKESPPNSNNVLFNTAYYGRAVSGSDYPWCMVFMWYIFRAAKLSHLFFDGGKTASCTALMTIAKKKGQFFTSGFRRGDLALFNWNGGKSNSQHVGIIEKVSGDYSHTIEGNTAVGNDSDGGEVMRRTRANSLIVGVYRPDYEEDFIMTQDDFNNMLAIYFNDLAKHSQSEWSDKEGMWKKAVTSGLFDGSMPQSPVTREQLAAVLGRLGLFSGV